MRSKSTFNTSNTKQSVLKCQDRCPYALLIQGMLNKTKVISYLLISFSPSLVLTTFLTKWLAKREGRTDCLSQLKLKLNNLGSFPGRNYQLFFFFNGLEIEHRGALSLSHNLSPFLYFI